MGAMDQRNKGARGREKEAKKAEEAKVSK